MPENNNMCTAYTETTSEFYNAINQNPDHSFTENTEVPVEDEHIDSKENYVEDITPSNDVVANKSASDVGTTKMIEEELSKSDKDNKFALIDIEKMIELVPSLNYIEAARLNQKVKKELENFKMAKTLLDAINGMDNLDPMNKKIASENALSDTSYKEDTQKFLEEYDNNIERFNMVTTELENRMKEFDSIPKTSKFLDDQMIDSLSKRIAENQEKNVLPDSAIMQNLILTKSIYENRDDLSYIERKAHVGYIITKYYKALKNHPEEELKKTKNAFLRIFNAKQLQIFENKILELFDSDEGATNLFMYHLYKIVNAEKDSGLYNWVKVLIMNVIDIEANIYDLPTSKEDYYSKIASLRDYYTTYSSKK